MEKGQIISGEFGKIVVRQKSDAEIQLGELLVAENSSGKVILQVFDLSYGSQISQVNLELAAGLKLEEGSELNFMDGALRNYKLAFLKPMIFVNGKETMLCKGLPSFFSKVRSIVKDDLVFLDKPKNALFVGNLRSGSSVLDFPVYLDGLKVFSHHVLIPATTGRGKSNLMSCLLWDVADKGYCGMLVLDPHDEYYGRNKLGLKDRGCVYYTPKNVPTGGLTLKINIHDLKPGHFNGVMEWSAPQGEAMDSYYRKYGRNWIDALLDGRAVDYIFNEGTIAVLRRRLSSLLNIEFKESKFFCNGVFDFIAGETTIGDIANDLERSKVVIVDTSNFSGPVEILIGSLISTEIFNRYRKYKLSGEIEYKPIISIVLEEAPRVLGKEVLEKGSNIFSTIAREGRKFKVGLCAITQLPSLIPRQILANMNTKIILGVEMAPEREAIIDSASQDLSTDSRNIASLDIGEAIITSNFSRFAMPVKIPKFSEFAKAKEEKDSRSFAGVKL